ncbi:anthrax toxin receptor-like [Peromyscus californicus insignis]|uniref:anthrax toxin receptor-like n=1 Tax=Peromyscus californicus insignis TaxID=564181 RepID=UPI0022A6C3E2|nr:anthrax toxin receptor-like [Peromyscus californicus insignis]
MWRRKNSKPQPCQATPDIYFVLEKSERMSRAWPHVHKFVEDMVKRVSNQDLRVSIITYSCKGNVILPLTGDREEILKGVERLKYSVLAGHEHLYRGLRKVWRARATYVSTTVGSPHNVSRFSLFPCRHIGSVYRPSMIISLLNSPLDDDAYQYSVEEADKARRMGASVYSVGVGSSKKDQIVGIADKPENAFPNTKADHLNDLIFPLASKACPSLKSLDTPIICIRESNPVVIRGYGFDFAMRQEEVICRFYFSDIDMSFKDVKAFNLTKTTVTCPGPIVEEPGKVIHVLLSLDNGRNFLNKNLFVASKLCGKSYTTDEATTTRELTTKTMTTTTTTTTTIPRTTTTLPTTTIPTTPLVTKELKPSIDRFIFAPILLALLLTLLLTGCFWQLCCLPPVEELPLPKPQPQPPKKKQPPPPVSPPAPPGNPPPIVIICCCTCGSLSVSRDAEGNVTVCNFNPQSCHQLPLMWPQTDDQQPCISFALLKALCAQDSCGPKAILPPSHECLPLASCSQCSQFPGSCSRIPSRLQLLTPSLQSPTVTPAH